MKKAGIVRDKTILEKMLERARGREDSEITLKARQTLAKKGYDWNTGEKIEKEEKR